MPSPIAIFYNVSLEYEERLMQMHLLVRKDGIRTTAMGTIVIERVESPPVCNGIIDSWFLFNISSL